MQKVGEQKKKRYSYKKLHNEMHRAYAEKGRREESCGQTCEEERRGFRNLG